jgi:hypothetical protein
MLRNRATALEVSGTHTSQTALEKPSNVLATARWYLRRGRGFGALNVFGDISPFD